ncbi:MAG TPA: PEP-CTERM sorting domain-containing protein [Burkholderiaceae bacterium]
MKALRFRLAAAVAALAFSGLAAASPNGNPTVDVMHTGTIFGYAFGHDAGGQFQIGPFPSSYDLSDGTSWEQGAGSFSFLNSTVTRVAATGSALAFTFRQPADGVLFQHTDYDSGDHSAQGTIGTPSQITLLADAGAKTGVMEGWVRILSNDPTWYSSFNYYSASVGQSVWWQTTVTLQGDATFTPGLFDTHFDYVESGVVDFTRVQAVPEPGNLPLIAAALASMLAWSAKRRRQ